MDCSPSFNIFLSTNQDSCSEVRFNYIGIKWLFPSRKKKKILKRLIKEHRVDANQRHSFS